MRHIDADYSSGFANGTSGKKTIEASPGTKVQNNLALFQRSDCQRISASESEIGSFRCCRCVLSGVAKRSRLS